MDDESPTSANLGNDELYSSLINPRSFPKLADVRLSSSNHCLIQTICPFQYIYFFLHTLINETLLCENLLRAFMIYKSVKTSSTHVLKF